MCLATQFWPLPSFVPQVLLERWTAFSRKQTQMDHPSHARTRLANVGNGFIIYLTATHQLVSSIRGSTRTLVFEAVAKREIMLTGYVRLFTKR